MADQDKHDHKHEPGRATVAVFSSRAEAREAIAALHKAHYTHTWMGTTSVAETDRGDETLTVESQGPGFFSGSQSLVDALVSRGVLGDVARNVEQSIEPGDVLVTVDPKDKEPQQAISLLQEHGGVVGGGARGTATGRATRPAVSGDTYGSADDEWEEEIFYLRADTPQSTRR